MTKQTNLTLGPATRQKLEELAEQYGSMAAVVRVAVDRLWQSEVVQAVRRSPGRPQKAGAETQQGESNVK